MAKRTATSAVAVKGASKLDSLIAAHAGDETQYSTMGDLPSGIKGGIARVNDCRIGVYENGDLAGEKYFIASAIVESPEVFNSPTEGMIRIKGLRTQIGPEPLCDTPNRRRRKTADDHVAWVLNELRKMGADTSQVRTEAQLTALMQAVVKAAPQIRFRTWGGEDWINDQGETVPGRVNHEWEGTTSYEGGGEAAVQDETGDVETNGHGSAPWESDDLAALGKAADEGDQGAAEKLAERAAACGVDSDSLPSWAEVATAILEAEGTQATETDGDETDGDEDIAAVAAKADEGDTDADSRMWELARQAGIDGDSYNSWSEAVEDIQNALGGGKEDEPGEIDYAALAERADNGDEEATAQLQAACDEAGIDSSAYDSWADLVPDLEGGKADLGGEEAKTEPGTDYVALGEAADNGDEEAAASLNEACDQYGIDPNEHASWVDVADAIRAAEEEAENTSEGLAKGDVVMYKPPKGKKPVECEVLHVNNAKGTVNLRDFASDEKYLNVKLTDLVQG